MLCCLESIRHTPESTESLLKACKIFLETRNSSTQTEPEFEKPEAYESIHPTHSHGSALRRFISHASIKGDAKTEADPISRTSSETGLSELDASSSSSSTGLSDKDSQELQSQCLRVINNAIADYDKNRYQLLEQKEFMINLLDDLINDYGNVDIINKELSILHNLTVDFTPGIKYLLISDLAIQALIHQLEMVTIKPGLSFTLLSYIIGEVLEQDHGSKRFPTDIMNILLRNASVKCLGSSPNESNGHDFQLEGKDAAMLVIKFVEAEARFEEYFASSREHLTLFIQLGLMVSTSIQDDPEFPEISRRMLASIGNISSHPSFQNIVPISLKDPIFALFVHHMKESPPAPRLAILYQGVSCVVLGNLATSREKVGQLLEEFPNAPVLAMKYLSNEIDPYALQGAHFIKNVTVNNPDICASVIDYGVVALIHKLLDNKLFVHLRLMGAQIAKNLFAVNVHSGLRNHQFLKPIVSLLIKIYKSEDKQSVRNEIILAFDASIDSVRTFFSRRTTPASQIMYLSKDEDFDGTQGEAVNDAELALARIFIHALHAMYMGLVNQEKFVVDPVIAMKATKALGLLSTFPKIPEDLEQYSKNSTNQSPQPLILQDIIKHSTEGSEVVRKDLIDLLSQFSSDLMECENLPASQHHFAVSTRHKAMIQSRHNSIVPIPITPSISGSSAKSLYKIKTTNHSQNSVPVTSDNDQDIRRSYKPVVNNLGFLGSQIRKWDNVDTELMEAANIAIRNATSQ